MHLKEFAERHLAEHPATAGYIFGHLHLARQDTLASGVTVTFLGDWKIIFRTIATVLKHEGINAANDATMPEFMGNEEANATEE